MPIYINASGSNMFRKRVHAALVRAMDQVLVSEAMQEGNTQQISPLVSFKWTRSDLRRHTLIEAVSVCSGSETQQTEDMIAQKLSVCFKDLVDDIRKMGATDFSHAVQGDIITDGHTSHFCSYLYKGIRREAHVILVTSAPAPRPS